MEADEFRQAMEILQESGEDVQLACLDLSAKWRSFTEFNSDAFKQQTVGKQKVNVSKKLLQRVLTQAAECGQRLEEFKEKLNYAIKTGMAVEEWAKQADMKGDSSALTALQSFGAATAKNFLSLVIGDRTSAAGVEQGNQAGSINKQSQEFCDLRAQLNNCLGNLEKLGESIFEMVEVTKEMALSIECAINIFIEQEKLRIKENKENNELQFEQERMLHEAEELEKKIQKIRDRKTEETAVDAAENSAANEEGIFLTSPGKASLLIKLLNNLITASEFARKLADGADSTGEMTALITELENCLMELTNNKNVADKEAIEFYKAIQEIRKPFDVLVQQFSDLSSKWDLFESSIIGIVEHKHLTQKQVRDCIQQLKLLLDCSKLCTVLHQECKKKSQHPMVAGTNLVQRCRAASKKPKAPIGVAAFAVMTAVADSEASKMERIATDLAKLVEKMASLLQGLRGLEDSLHAFIAVARKIVRNTEDLLELFKKPASNRKSKVESDEKLDERGVRIDEELEKLLGELTSGRRSRSP